MSILILDKAKRVPRASVLKLVRGDADTAVLRMAVRRYANGVDLAGLIWWVKIATADRQVDRIMLGRGDISTDGLIRLDWRLNYLAAAAAGTTAFEVEGRGSGGAVWQSGTYTITVADDLDGEPHVDPRTVTELQQLLQTISDDLPTVYAAKDAANAAARKADEAAEKLAVDLSGIRADVDELDERVTEIEQHGGGGGGGVVSVNGKSGNVVLNAADVGALPADTPIPEPYDDSDIRAEIAGKQDLIDDLDAIRAGAAAGATALQEVPDTYRTAAAQDVIDNELKDYLLQKATNPVNPIVGQWGRVKEIGADGQPVWETADLPAAMPGNPPNAGVVKVSSLNYGVTIDSLGILRARSASEWSITNGRNEIAPLFMNQFGQTLKAAMCDGYDPAWTSEEQAAAQQRIGILSVEEVLF